MCPQMKKRAHVLLLFERLLKSKERISLLLILTENWRMIGLAVISS
jgi:hypothetical protein